MNWKIGERKKTYESREFCEGRPNRGGQYLSEPQKEAPEPAQFKELLYPFPSQTRPWDEGMRNPRNQEEQVPLPATSSHDQQHSDHRTTNGRARDGELLCIPVLGAGHAHQTVIREGASGGSKKGRLRRWVQEPSKLGSHPGSTIDQPSDPKEVSRL